MCSNAVQNGRKHQSFPKQEEIVWNSPFLPLPYSSPSITDRKHHSALQLYPDYVDSYKDFSKTSSLKKYARGI